MIPYARRFFSICLASFHISTVRDDLNIGVVHLPYGDIRLRDLECESSTTTAGTSRTTVVINETIQQQTDKPNGTSMKYQHPPGRKLSETLPLPDIKQSADALPSLSFNFISFI